MRTYLLSHLGIGPMLRVMAAQLARRRRARIVYLETGGSDEFRSALLKLFGIVSTENSTRELGDGRDEDGINHFWLKDRVTYGIARRTLDELDFERISTGFGYRYDADYIRLFLDRAVNSEFYGQIAQCCIFETLVRDEGIDEPVLVIRNSPFAAAIRAEFMARLFPHVIRYPAMPVAARVIRELAALAKQIGLAAFAALAGGHSSARQSKKNVGIGLDSTSIEMLAGGRLMPWLVSSAISPERIVCYIDGKKADKSLAAICATLDREKIRLIDYRSWRPVRFAGQYLARLTSGVIGLLRLTLSGRGSFGLRLWAVAWFAIFVRSAERLSAFFNEEDIVINIHSGDSEPLIVAKLWAVESRGGVDLSWQFSGSGEDMPMNFRTMRQHMFFPWGRAHAEIIKRSDDLCRGKAPNLFFIGGHVMQQQSKDKLPVVAAAVEKLAQQTQGLVIAVFDTLPTRYTAYSRKGVQQFYSAILDKAAADRRIALVIKPHTANLQQYDFFQKIRALEDRGQLAMLPSTVRPFQIFPHVDLAIIMSVRNSAGMEAAIAEIPHIFFDTPSIKCHPFYDVLPPGIIATDQDELIELIDAHAAERGRTMADPVFRKYVEWMDPFRDGRGHERFGFLVSALADGLDRHGTAFAAMPEVVERYRSKAGADSVVAVRWPYSDHSPLEPVRNLAPREFMTPIFAR